MCFFFLENNIKHTSLSHELIIVFLFVFLLDHHCICGKAILNILGISAGCDLLDNVIEESI